MAILQGGKFPTFLDSNIVDSIFSTEDDGPVITSLRKGMDESGIVQVRF